MPKKRFSRYKFAKKVSKGQAADGSPLARYMDYASGKVVVEYDRNEASKPGGYVEVKICPFGTEDGEIYQVSMSKRSFDNLGNLIGNKEAFNHQTTADTDVVNINSSLSPAKAIVNLSGTGTTSEPSKITGVKYYKETGSASYTVPFGGNKAAGTGRVFLNVAKEIKASVRTKSTESTVSFQPERWYSI
ncbi:MAG: hypothetical protein ACRC2V_22615 [Xenococcaceae cyanobacterium]